MLSNVIFLATLNKVLVDYFSEPLQRKFPNHDFWWLLYFAGITGLIMGWFSQLNLFVELFPEVVVGRIMTSILVGGGSSLIHKLFESGVGALRSVVAKNWEQAQAFSGRKDETDKFVTGESSEPAE